MALLTSPADVGPNSLAMLSPEMQDYDDFATGEVLIAAVKARADYECPITPEAFQGFGPIIMSEVAQEQQRQLSYLVKSTAQLQPILSEIAAQGAVIPDSEIANAPQAAPIGAGASTTNTAPGSTYTAVDIAAANDQPMDWTQTLILRPHAEVYEVQATRKTRKTTFSPPMRSAPSIMPGTPWGLPSAATPGHCCGVNSNPWGKLLLFTGLGLIAAGMLQGKGR